MDGAKNKGKCIVENCTTSSHLNVGNPPDHKFVRRENDLTKDCHCIIRHPQTPGERQVIANALEYARRVGDSNGIQLAMAQLTSKCD